MVIIMFDVDTAINSFGNRLQEARLLRNVTQDELGEKCNVTAKHISNIERGASSISVNLLLSICNYLNISPISLFCDYFSPKTDKDDCIFPLEKHNTFIKYAKLSKSNQDFIDSSINHMFEEQSRRK